MRGLERLARGQSLPFVPRPLCPFALTRSAVFVARVDFLDDLFEFGFLVFPQDLAYLVIRFPSNGFVLRAELLAQRAKSLAALVDDDFQAFLLFRAQIQVLSEFLDDVVRRPAGAGSGAGSLDAAPV